LPEETFGKNGPFLRAMRPQQEFLTWTAAVQQLPVVDGIYLISGPNGFWGAAFFSTELQTWQNFIGTSMNPSSTIIAWAICQEDTSLKSERRAAICAERL